MHCLTVAYQLQLDLLYDMLSGFDCLLRYHQRRPLRYVIRRSTKAQAFMRILSGVTYSQTVYTFIHYFFHGQSRLVHSPKGHEGIHFFFNTRIGRTITPKVSFPLLWKWLAGNQKDRLLIVYLRSIRSFFLILAVLDEPFAPATVLLFRPVRLSAFSTPFQER